MSELKGNVSGTKILKGSISAANPLKGNISSTNTIYGRLGVGSVFMTEHEVYEGPYQVTPAVTSQTLDTSNKLMQSDVLVEGIPYAEVTNNSGGKTASIG